VPDLIAPSSSPLLITDNPQFSHIVPATPDKDASISWMYHYSVPHSQYAHTWPIMQYTKTHDIKTLLLSGNTSHMYQVTTIETPKGKPESGYHKPRQHYHHEILMDHSCHCHDA
jgi:hypothetical protein